MGLARKQWIMIAGAVVVVVLLALAPRTPSGKAEENRKEVASARVSEDPNSGSTPHAEAAAPMTSKNPQVAEILAELNNGGAPMQTILKLRDLAEKDPNNVEAQFNLGIFSWQTGQYDKAMVRFKRTIELDAKGYPDAYAYLAQAYATLDSSDKAMAAIETYKTLVTDTALLNGADRFIADIKTKKTK